MKTSLTIELSNEQLLSLLADMCGGLSEEEANRAHQIIGADPKYIIQAANPADWSPKEKCELLNKLFGVRNYTDKGQIIANVSDILYGC